MVHNTHTVISCSCAVTCTLSSLESRTANLTAGESEDGHQLPAAFACCNNTKAFPPKHVQMDGAIPSPTGKRLVTSDVILSRYLIERAADIVLNLHSIWASGGGYIRRRAMYSKMSFELLVCKEDFTGID